MAPPSAKAAILSLEQATFTPETAQDGALENATLRLSTGELALVRLEPECRPVPLAEAAQGLAHPSRGRVLFLGRDWSGLGPFEAARLRARIGRVFADRSWVSNLDVAENITLAQRHHTVRPVEEIQAEAEALARRFGLPGLPPGRPAAASPQALQRAGWVRAFLGDPALLILEQPTRQADREGAARLFEAVHDARARGAAVLWTTQEERILREPSLDPVWRMRMAGPSLLMEEGAP